MWFEDQPAPSHPADQKTGPGEEGATSKGSYLEEPLELKPVVASFLRGHWRPPRMKVIGCLHSPWSWSSASGYHGGPINENPGLVDQVVNGTRDRRL